jgi:hypothetical protein
MGEESKRFNDFNELVSRRAILKILKAHFGVSEITLESCQFRSWNAQFRALETVCKILKTHFTVVSYYKAVEAFHQVIDY